MNLLLRCLHNKFRAIAIKISVVLFFTEIEKNLTIHVKTQSIPNSLRKNKSGDLIFSGFKTYYKGIQSYSDQKKYDIKTDI